MSTLKTVNDYISDMRTLLLDTIAPYRYDDPSLLIALNLAFMEGRRIRPDLFVFHDEDGDGDELHTYHTVDNRPVPMEKPFRMAFVYGACSHALARDQEDVQDSRSNSFMNVFSSVLTGLKQAPVQGGTPGGPQQKSGG